MKRVLVAIVLLLCICGGCILSIVAQRNVLHDLTAATHEIEALFLNGHIPEATAAAETFADDYSHTTRYLALLLPHNTLNELEKSVVSLPAILKTGEHKDFVAEVRRCRLLLENLQKLEIPTLQNIL